MKFFSIGLLAFFITKALFADSQTEVGNLNAAGKACLTSVVNGTPFPLKVSLGSNVIDVAPRASVGSVDQGMEIVSQFLSPVAIGEKSTLKVGDSKYDSSLALRPEISGSYQTQIGAFTAESGLAISAMKGQGLATLEGLPIWSVWETKIEEQSAVRRETLDPWSAICRPGLTFSFKVWMQDEDQFWIRLQESEDVYFQLSLTSVKDGICTLVRNDNDGQRILVSSKELSFLPGNYTQFWISIDSTTIVVGQGRPGQNPCMIYTGLLSKNISKIGLTTADQPIVLTNMAISSPLYCSQAATDRVKYYSKSEKQSKGKTVDLRETGRLALGMKTPANVRLLTSSEGQVFNVNFDFSNKTVSVLKVGSGPDKVLAKGSWTELLKDSLKCRFLVWTDGTQLFVAQETEPDLMAQVQLPTEFQLITVAQDDGFSSLVKIEFASEPEMVELYDGLEMLSNGAGQFLAVFAKTSIVVKKSFKYQIYQDGQTILVDDKIYNQTWVLGKAPQQQAIYPIMFKVSPNGVPDVSAQGKSINPVKWGMNIAATAFQVRFVVLNTYAQKIAQVAAPELKENLMLTAQNLQACLGAAAAGTMASAITATANNVFRSADSYVFRDAVKSVDNSVKTVDESILRANLEIDSMVQKIDLLTLSNAADFDYACNLYQQLLAKIIDARMITQSADRGIKEKVVKGLEKLAAQLPVGFSHAKDIERIYQGLSADQGNFWLLSTQLISVLVNAITNKAFLDPIVQPEMALIDRLFAAMTTFSQFMSIKYAHQALGLDLDKKSAASGSEKNPLSALGGLGGIGGSAESSAKQSSNVTSSAEAKTEALTIPSTQNIPLDTSIAFDPKTGLYLELSLKSAGQLTLWFFGLERVPLVDKISQEIVKALDPRLKKLPKPGARLYGICFDSSGVWICFSKNGPIKSKTLVQDRPEVKLNGFKYSDFWVSFCSGTLEFGIFSPEKETLLSVTDPYFSTIEPLYSLAFSGKGAQSQIKIKKIDLVDKDKVSPKFDIWQHPLQLIKKKRDSMKDFGVLTDLEKFAFDPSNVGSGLNAAVEGLDAKKMDYSFNTLDSAASNFEYGSALTYSQRNVEDWSRQDAEYEVVARLEEKRSALAQPTKKKGLDSDAKDARDDRAQRASQQKLDAQGAAAVTGDIDQLKQAARGDIGQTAFGRDLRYIKTLSKNPTKPLSDFKAQLRGAGGKNGSAGQIKDFKKTAIIQGVMTGIGGLMQAGQEAPVQEAADFGQLAGLNAAQHSAISGNP